MTSEEIRIKAQLLSGFQINDITAFNWVKDAANSILREHPLASPTKIETFDITEDGQDVQLQSELVRIENITESGRRQPINEFIFNVNPLGEVKFWRKGKYDVAYKYVPEMPNNKNMEIPIPNRYAETIPLYVCACIRARIYGQGDNEAQSFENKFYSALQDIDVTLERTNKRHRRMPARY